jgi:hypothetical protein
MFSLKQFVKTNLIGGVANGIFAKEYAAILATNYLVKGILSETDVAEISEAITPDEPTESEE